MRVKWREFWDRIEKLEFSIRGMWGPKNLGIYGVPRSGIYVALGIASLGARYRLVDTPEEANIIVDDVIASGATKNSYKKFKAPFHALYTKQGGDEWITFPWNETASGPLDASRRLIEFIGDDISREGLRETPERFLKAWTTWSSGYKQDPKEILKTFSSDCDELVVQQGIPVYSHCEHHLTPFFGEAAVGYIPQKKVVGLSKLSRLVDCFARRLQIQENLTNQIAEALDENLSPLGVGVVLRCRHLCMESRGVQRQGTITQTSALRGALKEEGSARAEFFSMVGPNAS